MKLPEELQYIQNSLKPQKTTTQRMDGKIVVITGATSGIGYHAARKFASMGAQVVMVSRNPEKAAHVSAELLEQFGCHAQNFTADFTRLAEVSRVARQISDAFPKIDVLVNNAGVFNKRRRLTPDGNEETFGVIHLAAFLLTHCLLPNLKNAAPSRIIEVNSEAHRFGGLKMTDLDWSKRLYIALQAYGAAKIAQILAGRELAERLAGSGVTIATMHPGAVRTNIGMNNNIFYRLYNRYLVGLFLKDASHAAEALYYLAAAPELASVSGKYYNQTIEEKPASYVIKTGLQQEVWLVSQQMIKPFCEE